MSKLTIQLNKTVSFTGEGDSLTEAMLEVSSLVEAYRALAARGADPDDYTPVARKVKSKKTGDVYTYHELIRNDGAMKLELGTRKDGSGVFPKDLVENKWGTDPADEQSDSGAEAWG